MSVDERTGDDDVASRRDPRAWAVGAAGLMGAAGLAITQPVLDLFGRNPEFFVAGRYGPRQIIAFGLLVALVPSAVAVASSTVAWLAAPRLGAFVHGGALAGFVFLFGLVVAGHLGVGTWWLALAGAAALAALVVWLHRTRAVARSLLSHLAVGTSPSC